MKKDIGMTKKHDATNISEKKYQRDQNYTSQYLI